jgi:hypothetical protein
MAQPSSKLVELARLIVEQEAGGSNDPAASAAAVDNACGQLRDHLVDLLGSGGVSALLRRALHLAQREQPVLAPVAMSGEPDGCFSGLAESLTGSTEEEAAAASASVLTHMLGLLVVLLGEDLGMKPVHKLWPQGTRARKTDE